MQVIRRGAPEPSAAPPAAAPPAPVQPVRPVPVRPTSVAPTPRPVAPTPRPVSPAPVAAASAAAAVTPGVVPGAPPAPRPSGPRLGGKPSFGGKPAFGGPGGPRRFPRPPPGPPPTADQVQALAKKERVPARIAKGELEGKMKCRIWKKLHAEEARRFDQAYVLMSTTPGLDLADAFGIVQSGLPVPEFMARRARAKKKEEVKQARAAVNGEPIDAFIKGLIDQKIELSVVLGERTVLDVLTEVQPVSFNGERTGRIDKLNVVLLARKSVWEQLGNNLERDPRLAQKPAPVARQPARRPVSDPRPLVDQLGKPLKIVLRNGITLTQPLLQVGPFDVLVGSPGEELFIPLHAMMSWAPAS